MPPEQMELVFPLRGLNENWAFGRQPEGTTPDALNVRAYDSVDSRLRGGQRDGASKYFADVINGSNAIQAIDSLTLALDPSAIEVDELSFSDTFTQADGVLDDTNYTLLQSGSTFQGNPLAVTISTTRPEVKSNQIIARNIGTNTGVAVVDTPGPSTAYILRADLHYPSSAGDPAKQGAQGFVFRVDDPSGGLSNTEYAWAGVTDYGHSTAATSWKFTIIVSAAKRIDITGAAAGYSAGHFQTSRVLELRVNGNVMTLFLDDAQLITLTSSILVDNTNVGILSSGFNSNTEFFLDDFEVYTGKVPASLRQTKLLAISGGSIYTGTTARGLSLPASGGSGVLTDSMAIPPKMQAAYQKSYFCDGRASGYRIYNPVPDTVTVWTPTAGALPVGGNSLIETVSAVTIDSSTQITFSAATSLTNGDSFVIQDSVSNNKSYRVTDASSDPVIIFTPSLVDTDDTTGDIYTGELGAKDITLYRGRIVLWGLSTDPQNWFMSAVGDPLNWDYGATPSATMAVAGSNTDVGLLGDVLIACAPYSDDLMIMGGDHTLWVMRGDPAAGGLIDNISYQTGIVNSGAYAWNPKGEFYFVGAGQLWRMNAGSIQPESISQNRLDETFQSIDLNAYRINLIWDRQQQGLHIFFIPNSQPTTSNAPVHIYWDQRTDGFWKDQYPEVQGPTAIHTYDADDPDDRATLLGGWDSYIRLIDSSATNDDGTAIDSFILYPPIVAGGPLNNIRVNRIMVTLDSASDDVTLSAYAEDTPQKAVESATSNDVAVNITAVSISNKTFTVAEDWSERIAGDHLLVAGSTGNDGDYTLASLTGTGPTVLTVNETVADATVDGTIQYKDRVKFIRTLAAGRTTVLNRIAGNAVLLKLANSTAGETWAIENLIANVDAIGLTRKNQL